jgi:predicted phosphodiesterase
MESRILILGDIHAQENAITELKEIFDEVYYNQKDYRIVHVVLLGDVFSSKRPNSIELNFITEILCYLQRHCLVTIVTGNHEEESSLVSALDYTTHFGIELIRHHGIIDIQGKKLYVGHHFVDTDDKYVKDEKFKTKELSEQYDLTLLGHNHKFTKHAPNVICLGAIRRVNFGELDYGLPQYALLNPKTFELEIKPIFSAYPMIEILNINTASKKNASSKVQLTLKSFEDYIKVINQLPELENKFTEFKVKHDYTQVITAKTKEQVQQKGKTFEEIFNKFLEEKVENLEVKQFIKGNLNVN